MLGTLSEIATLVRLLQEGSMPNAGDAVGDRHAWSRLLKLVRLKS